LILSTLSTRINLYQPQKNRKSPIARHAGLEPPQKRVRRAELCFGFGALFALHEQLAAIEQIATYFVSMVEDVLFARRFADGDVWGFQFVVRAAGALPALGVPPFRIWHDLFR
jgi:hypothetical protein